MKILDSYINTVEGRQKQHIKVIEKRYGNTYAVFVDGFAWEKLDMEFGVGVEFMPDSFEEFMSDERHSDFWCRPVFGKNPADIPDETQGLIYKKTDEEFGVVLPVVSEKYKCVLKGTVEGNICARIFSWYENLTYCKALAFVYAEGKNPFELLKNCTETALNILNNGCRTREQRRYPEIFEYLGWCSWDAMEIRVNEADILKKCEEFRQKNIPVKWAIIDDMWGEVHDFYDEEYKDSTEMFHLMHSSKLYSFKADPKRFPNGLKHCIDEIKKYDIKVGMWHPTTGYWFGIDPEGEIYREFKNDLITTKNGRIIPSYEQDKAYMYYSRFHDYLQSCGAEFVKIDNQSMTERFYKRLAPVGEVARAFHSGMEASVGQHFDNNMINCMGMASEDMWNRSVSPISRCSGDFLPENSAWFVKHIMQCSYNCLIQGQFYFCDWDMWWTDDAQAEKNSILRAISGGPIYVSDKLERSNRDVLMPLCLSDGKILRCDRPAMPTADCITVDPTISETAFKLHNMCGDSGVMAVFNLDSEEKTVKGTISPSDIDGLEGCEFAVYEHFSKTLDILKFEDKLEIELKNKDDYRLYVIVPIVDGFAPIGRTDKFVSPKTIKAVKGKDIELFETGEYAYVDNGKLIIKKD